MQQSSDAHATLAGLDNIAAWIPPIPQDTDQNDERDRLAMGARILTSWLRQGSEPAVAGNHQSSRMPLLVAASVGVMESVLLGVLAHPAFLVLLLVTVTLLVLGLRRQSAPERSVDADWRAEYQRLGLPAPAAWTPDAVEALIEELLRRVRRIQADQEARQRWQYVRDERPVAVHHAEEVDRQVAEWCARFGVPAVRDVAALHTLANAISSWQESRGRAASALALQAEAQARVEAALTSINAVLLHFGYPAVDGPAGISSAIDDLAARDRDRAEAAADEQRAESRLAGQLLPQQQRCRDDLDSFFDRLGLADDDGRGLQTLLDRLPEYRAATVAVGRAGLALEHARADLGDAVALAEQPPAVLDLDLRTAQAQHAELDDIVQQIAAINARIEQARQGSNLEEALAGVETTAGVLRDAREASEALVAGWALAEFVRRQTRDIDRPRVFHRARELFARITQGRYVLDVETADPPRFRARDTVTGAGHELDELSSGTRLQLLLAVRVAFVEQQERGPMLPLILDETMGNSDEHRARAIIDATVQIACEGRQVLYLTAQHDEVRKWQAVMADRPDVPFALVDLAQVRGLADWERLPVAPPQAWPLPAVPAPNGHDREAYGQLLNVPGIDLTAADSGYIHLWHLIDEPLALHSLLSLQIETWGQLRTLAEHGGVSTPFASPALIERCRARARVIETLAEAARVGRGRPVDRAALLESGAITTIFIDRATQLTIELNGDAKALLDALEAGQLRSFHTNARLRLQEYLEEYGYIDLTPPLPPELIRARVLASGGQALADGLLTHEWINTMLAAAGTIFVEERSAR
jgi:hypothetical protein